MTISVVIVTKDTKGLLMALLGSINEDTSLKPSLREVVIIDNASEDGTEDVIRDSPFGVSYIKNDRNMGFSVAVNRGFLTSKGEYILFLNSDTMVIPGEINKMLTYMHSNKDVGICGPQLVYPDMRLQRSFAYIPSLLLEIIPRSILEIVFPQKYSARLLIRDPRSEIRNFDVPSLIGAAILVRRSALEALGGFDERFFFFLEETDLCIRAKKKGQRVVFYPNAKVIHIQGKTVGKRWVNGRIEYNISLYKFIKKHHLPFYFYLFTVVRLLKCFILLIILSVLPFLLFKKRVRRTYVYYFRLFLWHLKGCPDGSGLRL